LRGTHAVCRNKEKNFECPVHGDQTPGAKNRQVKGGFPKKNSDIRALKKCHWAPKKRHPSGKNRENKKMGQDQINIKLPKSDRNTRAKVV